MSRVQSCCDHIRRRLTASQLAVMAVLALPLFEKEAKERQRATQFNGRDSQGQYVRMSDRLANTPSGRSDELAGKAAGVSRAYVAIAKMIGKRDPAVLERVRQGEIAIHRAQFMLQGKRHSGFAKRIQGAVSFKKANHEQKAE